MACRRSSNLATVTQDEAEVASILTISVEIGFYAEILPKGADPETAPRAAAATPIPAGAGDACPVYADAARRQQRPATRPTTVFQTTATRRAEADLPRRRRRLRLRRAQAPTAFENGVGINDMTGADPAQHRDRSRRAGSPAATDRINRLVRRPEQDAGHRHRLGRQHRLDQGQRGPQGAIALRPRSRSSPSSSPA